MPVKFGISVIVMISSSSWLNEVSQADEFILAEAFCAALILCNFLLAKPFRDASRIFFFLL